MIVPLRHSLLPVDQKPTRMKRLAAILRAAPKIPLLLVSVFLVTALLADLIAVHSPTEVVLPQRLIPPMGLEGGSWDHPLGTDALGRDILTRIIYGARTSLVVAFLTIVVAGCVGAALGIAAGYFGGWFDSVVGRVIDLSLAFPVILLAILLVMVLGPNTTNLVLAVSLVLWARFARVIRGEVLQVVTNEYIALARISGASNLRIMYRHVLPNVTPTLIVILTFQVGWIIIVEATLSFLGAGVPPPTPAWGSMVADGRNWVTTAWWVSAFPGAAITLVVLAFNLLGDWLRDALDPRLRQV